MSIYDLRKDYLTEGADSMAFKNITAISLSVMLILPAIANSLSDEDFAPLIASAVEIIDSGTCGENVTWTLDDEGTLVITGNGEIVNYNNYDWGLNVKSVIIKNGVTKLGNGAFSYCTNLESATIADSVTSIGTEAFSYCTSLRSITIPDSVTSIGAEAFTCCAFKSIIIPDSVTSIAEYAFKCCTDLSSITILNPECKINLRDSTICDSFDFSTRKGAYNGTIIGFKSSTAESYANYYGYKFKAIEESSSMIIDRGTCDENLSWTLDYYGTLNISGTGNLKKRSFLDNAKLIEKVVINEGITNIGNRVFDSCVNLKSVIIPDTVTDIGDSAFNSCYSLEFVKIPDSVKEIGEAAFCGCINLKSITIPASVTSIGKSAFASCPIKSITILNPECKIYNSINTLNGIIKSYTGSTAEAYANNFGYEFVALDEVPAEPKYGDVNNDGTISIADAVALQNFLLGRTQTLSNWKNADLCKDDHLDAFDMVLMRRLLIEKMN